MFSFLKRRQYSKIQSPNKDKEDENTIDIPILPILPTEGYCLVFNKETKYCKLSVNNNKLFVERISIETEHKESNSVGSKIKDFINKHYDYHLNQLSKRFDNNSLEINHIAFYSRDYEYIYIIIAMDDEHIVKWAEKLEIDVLIDPKNAIIKGRKDKEFHLAARSYCPSLDDNEKINVSYLQYDEVTLNKIPFNKWSNIHIGFSKHVGNIYNKNKIPERQYLRILYDVLTRHGACLNIEYALKLSEHPLCSFFALLPVIGPNIKIYFDKFGVDKKIFINITINDENMTVNNVINIAINEFEKRFSPKRLQSYKSSEFKLTSVQSTVEELAYPIPSAISLNESIFELLKEDNVFMLCYIGLNNVMGLDNENVNLNAYEENEQKMFGVSVNKIDSATKQFENKISSHIKSIGIQSGNNINNNEEIRTTIYNKYGNNIWYSLNIQIWYEIIEDIR
eukprot:9495_1